MDRLGQNKIINTISHMHTLAHQQEVKEQNKIISTINYMAAMANEEEDMIDFYMSQGANMGVFWAYTFSHWMFELK